MKLSQESWSEFISLRGSQNVSRSDWGWGGGWSGSGGWVWHQLLLPLPSFRMVDHLGLKKQGQLQKFYSCFESFCLSCSCKPGTALKNGLSFCVLKIVSSLPRNPERGPFCPDFRWRCDVRWFECWPRAFYGTIRNTLNEHVTCENHGHIRMVTHFFKDGKYTRFHSVHAENTPF